MSDPYELGEELGEKLREQIESSDESYEVDTGSTRKDNFSTAKSCSCSQAFSNLNEVEAELLHRLVGATGDSKDNLEIALDHLWSLNEILTGFCDPIDSGDPDPIESCDEEVYE